MSAEDFEIIEVQPNVKIWGEDFKDIKKIKAYKGKFVVVEDGKFFAKLFPKSKWDKIDFFHDELLQELGIEEAESPDVKDMIVGGGKIEVELNDNHIECRLYGKSSIYGEYDPDAIDTKALEAEIQKTFKLSKMPVLIVPDFQEPDK
jgi:hypothetical protein